MVRMSLGSSTDESSPPPPSRLSGVVPLSAPSRSRCRRPPKSLSAPGRLHRVVAAEAAELVVARAADQAVGRAVAVILSLPGRDHVLDVALTLSFSAGARAASRWAASAGAPSLATRRGDDEVGPGLVIVGGVDATRR
jgi:hypothetical protein